MSAKPRIAWVIGDAAGIGPELIAKTLGNADMLNICRPVLVGPTWLLERGMQHTQSQTPFTVCKPDQVDGIPDDTIPIVDKGWPEQQIPLGEVSEAAGKLSLKMLECAVHMAQDGVVSAIVKAPSNKESLKRGGNPYSTELPLMAEWLGETDYGEVNVVGDLFTTRVTSHVPLKDVASLLSPKKILKTIQLMHRVLVQAGHQKPKIGISGLNPHAGEHGLFGDEEVEIIEPGIVMARELGILVEGPLPPDTIFVRARRGDFPGVVTMYHDQGLIAMKLLGFDQGVSVSGGLSIPIMTTSHGTAYDIAGKGIADPGAFQAAVRLAKKMVQD
jgi:4-hydroxythreonine-4-phosphate dehydrogenase